MNLSEMRQALATGDIQLTKSLSQNFLHDGNQLRRIVAAAELTPADSVLEIGPGLGPLTELLMAQAGRVLAIEKDRRLADLLRQRLGAAPNLELVCADALDYLRQPRDWSGWKLAANLPYSVVSQILVELAEAPRRPERLVTTVQREVAHRIMAGSGREDYGVLSLLLQLRYESRAWFKIPAACFVPQPDVDSACVTLVRRPKPLLSEAEACTFTAVVKCGFSQRRKMMFKLLKENWPAAQIEAAFARLNLPAQVRAEDVALAQFVELARALHAPNDTPPADTEHAARNSKLGTQNLPTSEEIFDVVNARDEVIGQATRREVHQRGLMHRATHVLVLNARGEVFLQKRSMTKDRFPGAWDSSASGHLDHGETYDACAVRELREELGLETAPPPQRQFKIDACDETDQEHVWIYRCQAEGPFTLHPEEIERGGWFAPGEVTRWLAEQPDDFAGAFRLIWQRFSLP